MRILCVMVMPVLLLFFEFWMLGKKWGKKGGQEDCGEAESGENEPLHCVKGLQKCRWFLIYLLLSVILLLVLSNRLIWQCPEQSILFQCKRMSCMALLFVAAATDYRRQIIPNPLILSGLGFRIVLLLAEAVFERDILAATLFSELIGAVGIFIVCMVFLLIMRNSIGMGDIKLFMVMGLYLGLYSMIDAIMSSLILAFIGAVILLLMHKKGKKDSLPFAPAVLAGTYLSVFLTGI